MTRRAFTLLELLVVVAIMGILGTVSVGGYRAMQRGMEERGVMQNVNQFVRAAYQRAQIDRQPVAVYFWNETLRQESDTATPIVVGKAVAVRRSGRISRIQGKHLCDEFGDLRYSRLTTSDGDDDDQIDVSSGTYLYLMSMKPSDGSAARRSTVAKSTRRLTSTEPLLYGMATSEQLQQMDATALSSINKATAQIEAYAYYVIDDGNVDWKVGDAYGFEFETLELPHNYLFGSAWSRSVASPVAGETVLRFLVGTNSGSGAQGGTTGASTIQVSSLRPDASGGLAAKAVGTSANPTN